VRAPRVLLVDDEPRVLAALQRALSDAPFDVEIANGAEEALLEMARAHVDVIVSDQQMPGVLGAELLARVRERSPRTVRVMLTGDGRLGSAVDAINLGGVFKFLQKPCDIDDLKRTIDAAIESAPGAASARALSQAMGGLWIAAQPIVAPGQRRVHAFELLVRSRSRELPHPGALFEAAERADLVLDLEARILELAGDVARGAPPDVDIFVNLHPTTLRDPRLLDPLDAVASRIVLEITERAVLPDGMSERVAALRARGFRIAVDDLGAGYAGLTYVAKMRPDVVKLDMGLVHGVLDSRTHATLVAAVIDACNDLAITVVGEGVETAAMRDKLLDLGCGLQQGYLFGRPGPPFGAPTF
jgi:EAL domain-containing protein (putative c-di-GMP-specific phosphodiesterase class I)